MDHTAAASTNTIQTYLQTGKVARTVFVARYGGAAIVSFMAFADVRAHVDAWTARNAGRGRPSRGWVSDPTGVHVTPDGYTALHAYADRRPAR